jgi:hypothetical protein
MFDQRAYDRSDAKSKEVATRVLRNIGHIVPDKPEDYDIDIVSYLNGQPYYHELEHRGIWEKGIWPYSTIHIPYRKIKLLDKYAKFNYWVLNLPFTEAYIIDSDHIRTAGIDTVTTTRHIDGENFFDVSVNLCKYVSLV